MADDNVVVADEVSKIVAKFLFSTQRLQPTKHDVWAAVWSSEIASVHPPEEPEADVITSISGSSAELYIKVMLSCIGDVDIMHHFSNELAIPVGQNLAPSHLPSEFHSRVQVFKMIHSKYPGFVYLKPRYLLTENRDSNVYSAVLDDRQGFVTNESGKTNSRIETHGPAVTFKYDTTLPSMDRVNCVRCLLWPPQASDWSARRRNYDWPDSATVDRVVSNDVVQVAHRLCKHDEWERKVQWRLSFSRAEIVLLNSRMPVQQIVYHMLRIFVKTERLRDITDNTGAKILSTYHIKTLMLWACEVKPRNWWTQNTNVVRICVELLHILAVWLTDARCKHYFISKCNLMYKTTKVEIIADNLMSITEPWLSRWFVTNYIAKCAQLCPDNLSRLFDDVSTNIQLQTAVSAVVDWRRNTAISDLWTVYDSAEHWVAAAIYNRSVTAHSAVCSMKEFENINLQLSDYIIADMCLHVALKIANNDFTMAFMDILSTLCGQQFSGGRRYRNQRSSVWLLSQAANLLKVVNNSRSTVQLIEIELSKAYLYRALRCKDSDNDSIYCLANVYLAVLYYTTGQYQTAIDHCTLVTRSQDHSQCSSHVVQDVLPTIGDDIDNMLGLAVFYQYVRRTALNQQQTQHVSVFSTELFAHYLHIRCLSVTECHQLTQTLSTDQVQRYRKNISDRKELFIADLLLFKSSLVSSELQFPNKSLVYQRVQPTQNPTELNTTGLVELLQKSAVEHLTTFRQFEAREFCSVATIVTTDFEAMYAYNMVTVSCVYR